jgi:uncharacterized protein YneF (UPF0154 family)
MNYSRILLAAFVAFVLYFVIGGLWFSIPAFRAEFSSYPAIYRSQESVKSMMPGGMAAMFVSMVVLAVLYAMLYKGGSGLAEGARFGALIGVFAISAFVIHNYVNLNIGLRLTILQSVTYMVAWVITGVVIGAIYRPL